MTKEQLRMQMLAGIITESEYNVKIQEGLSVDPEGNLQGDYSEYYAIINYYGDPSEGTPYYVQADSKEDLINQINQAIESQIKETGIPYSLYSIKNIEDISHHGHIIGDDHVLATGWREVFGKDMEEFADKRGNYPKKFKP
jgi:hypothetical protein